jgi:hypothetical protein
MEALPDDGFMFQALHHEHCKVAAGKVGTYVLLVLLIPGGIFIALALLIARIWRGRASPYVQPAAQTAESAGD